MTTKRNSMDVSVYNDYCMNTESPEVVPVDMAFSGFLPHCYYGITRTSTKANFFEISISGE